MSVCWYLQSYAFYHLQVTSYDYQIRLFWIKTCQCCSLLCFWIELFLQYAINVFLLLNLSLFGRFPCDFLAITIAKLSLDLFCLIICWSVWLYLHKFVWLTARYGFYFSFMSVFLRQIVCILLSFGLVVPSRLVSWNAIYLIRNHGLIIFG